MRGITKFTFYFSSIKGNIIRKKQKEITPFTFYFSSIKGLETRMTQKA